MKRLVQKQIHYCLLLLIIFHNTSNADMMKITSDGLRVDDILLTNGTNRLVLDDDTHSSTANGVSLTGVIIFIYVLMKLTTALER